MARFSTGIAEGLTDEVCYKPTVDIFLESIYYTCVIITETSQINDHANRRRLKDVHNFDTFTWSRIFKSLCILPLLILAFLSLITTHGIKSLPPASAALGRRDIKLMSPCRLKRTACCGANGMCCRLVPRDVCDPLVSVQKAQHSRYVCICSVVWQQHLPIAWFDLPV